MGGAFEWNEADFQTLVDNCPDEPVTPFIFRYFKRSDRLLEAGCGSGRFVVWLARQGYDIEGLEIGTRTVATLNRVYPELRIRQGDVRRLPYADGSYDGILSLGVIEHVEEGMRAPIAEMHRVLKPGGIALVIVPSFNRIRRIKSWTGIYYLHAALDLLRHSNRIRRLFGKPPLDHEPEPPPPVVPGFARWPRFGRFFEYRLRPGEFEQQLRDGGFEILESVPTSLVDGLYHEIGWPFVRFGHLRFELSAGGRRLNDFLSRHPFWHNHMHLCVVRKGGDR